jgi:hypothetical protein
VVSGSSAWEGWQEAYQGTGAEAGESILRHEQGEDLGSTLESYLGISTRGGPGNLDLGLILRYAPGEDLGEKRVHWQNKPVEYRGVLRVGSEGENRF